MTTVTSAPEVASTSRPEPTPVPVTETADPMLVADSPRGRLTPGRVAQLVGLWLVILVACVALVLYLVEPIFQQRTQASLLRAYQADISHAHYSIGALSGSQSVAAPDLGTPVGVVEIPALHLRQVVVEGVGSTQTQDGPGHVPGTAAPGQPGNSAVVGRRSTYGGPFGSLSHLRQGERILVTTVQGQTVYTVRSVRDETITTQPPAVSALGGSTTAQAATGRSSTANAQLGQSSQAVAGAQAGRSVDLVQLYGPTKANQLTLVTSSSAWPLNQSKGTVVIATMTTQPFQATPQNGRTSNQTGLSGDSSAWTGLVLALQGLALAVVGATFLYRRFGVRVSYLLTTPPLILFVILIAEAASRLLPAWT
jgi:sortase A